VSSAILYPLAFVVALGVLVTVHEFGHFWVARRLGVKVLRFSVGFGKPLWSRRSRDGETEYVIAGIPLGGYVKMLDEREGEVAPEELHRAFNNKPVATRIAVVVAGPLFNLLFAALVFWVVFVSGVHGVRPLVGGTEPGSVAARAGFVSGDEILKVNGQPSPTWDTVRLAAFNAALDHARLALEVRGADGAVSERTIDLSAPSKAVEPADILKDLGFQAWTPPAVLGRVMPDSPAAKAGLRAGDRVTAVDGQPISDWLDWVKYVRGHPDKWIETQVQRDGQALTLRVRPAAKEIRGKVYGQVGVRLPDDALEKLDAVRRYGPLEAVGAAVHRTWEMSALMLRVLGAVVTGHASLDNISGPLTIAQYAGESASLGLVEYLGFLGLISVSLGVLNLLPIPILDGGHLMYYLIELVKGSPVSEQAQALGQRVGILLLLMLMGLAFYNDFMRLLFK